MKTEIELAKQAGWEYADDDRGFAPLWRFAEMVRAAEREAVLDLVDDYAKGNTDLRDAIRARGNT